MFTGVPLLSPHSSLIFSPCFPYIQLNSLPTIWTVCSNTGRPGTGYCICGTCIDNANYKNVNGQSLEKGEGWGRNLILKWWGFSFSQRNWRFWSHLQGYCLGLSIQKYLHVRSILLSFRGFYSQFLRSIPISFTQPPSPPPRDRAVNPPHLQILRIDGEWVIDDVIMQGTWHHFLKKKKKRTKKMLF